LKEYKLISFVIRYIILHLMRKSLRIWGRIIHIILNKVDYYLARFRWRNILLLWILKCGYASTILGEWQTFPSHWSRSFRMVLSFPHFSLSLSLFLSLYWGVMSFRRGGYLALPDLTTCVLIAAKCSVIDFVLERAWHANI